jgi:hypothetical protein
MYTAQVSQSDAYSQNDQLLNENESTHMDHAENQDFLQTEMETDLMKNSKASKSGKPTRSSKAAKTDKAAKGSKAPKSAQANDPKLTIINPFKTEDPANIMNLKNLKGGYLFHEMTEEKKEKSSLVLKRLYTRVSPGRGLEFTLDEKNVNKYYGFKLADIREVNKVNLHSKFSCFSIDILHLNEKTKIFEKSNEKFCDRSKKVIDDWISTIKNFKHDEIVSDGDNNSKLLVDFSKINSSTVFEKPLVKPQASLYYKNTPVAIHRPGMKKITITISRLKKNLRKNEENKFKIKKEYRKKLEKVKSYRLNMLKSKDLIKEAKKKRKEAEEKTKEKNESKEKEEKQNRILNNVVKTIKRVQLKENDDLKKEYKKAIKTEKHEGVKVAKKMIESLKKKPNTKIIPKNYEICIFKLNIKSKKEEVCKKLLGLTGKTSCVEQKTEEFCGNCCKFHTKSMEGKYYDNCLYECKVKNS